MLKIFHHSVNISRELDTQRYMNYESQGKREKYVHTDFGMQSISMRQHGVVHGIHSQVVLRCDCEGAINRSRQHVLLIYAPALFAILFTNCLPFRWDIVSNRENLSCWWWWCTADTNSTCSKQPKVLGNGISSRNICAYIVLNTCSKVYIMSRLCICLISICNTSLCIIFI